MADILGLNPRPDPVPPCTGKCRGERPAWDSPAKLGRYANTGRRVMFCTCCQNALTLVTKKDMTEHIAAGRLDPSVKLEGARLFACDYCHYDCIVGKEVVPR